jgi:hypothetical protein
MQVVELVRNDGSCVSGSSSFSNCVGQRADRGGEEVLSATRLYKRLEAEFLGRVGDVETVHRASRRDGSRIDTNDGVEAWGHVTLVEREAENELASVHGCKIRSTNLSLFAHRV